jgi:hypothetical protein
MIPYIFTECYNCPIVIEKMLETYLKFHDIPLNVYCTKGDIEYLSKFNSIKLINFIDVTHDSVLETYHKNGHYGTAYIYRKAINDSPTNYIIHIDSDVIFFEECLTDIINKFKEGYDIIGTARCYKNNLNGRKDLSNLDDVTQTYFYGFNKNKISKHNDDILLKMIVGLYNPLNHPILDFFDPVAFDIIKNGGKVFFLDKELYGGMDINGSKKNSFGIANEHSDFGSKLIHFAGIGSGEKTYKNGTTPNGYFKWGLYRFYIYYRLFYNEKLIDVNWESTKMYDDENSPIMEDFYNDLKNKLKENGL